MRLLDGLYEDSTGMGKCKEDKNKEKHPRQKRNENILTSKHKCGDNRTIILMDKNKGLSKAGLLSPPVAVVSLPCYPLA